LHGSTASRTRGDIAIASGEVIDGRLPANAARLVKQWTLARQSELLSN
jgi:hypothetical protein